MLEPTKLLVLSSDRTTRRALAASLSSEFQVFEESDRQEAQNLLDQTDIDVVVVDLSADESATDEVMALYRHSHQKGVPVVVMADDQSRTAAMGLVGRGLYDYFRKPPHLGELKLVVHRASQHRRLTRDLQHVSAAPKPTRCDRLIGESVAMQQVYDMIRRVADLDANVVIRGESGTGKELVACAIHNLGSRSEQPFVPVAFGAIPETLMESELFGHERGAFTGASGSKEGYFERAGDGTLFLDEVGELALSTQVKLLRVLQEREFTRVGGKKTHDMNARMVFATHRNLETMVEQGEFRQDLYYRVQVIRIDIPALRHRKEDLPELARHFISKFGESFGKPGMHLTAEGLQEIVRHDWPGNVRELENVVQRAVILAEDAAISGQAVQSAFATEPRRSAIPQLSGTFEDQVKQFKLSLIHSALEEANGNKTLASSRLGITRAYLHRLLSRSVTTERNGAANDSDRDNARVS
jgi:DNA-binding NtrC family response regulator